MLKNKFIRFLIVVNGVLLPVYIFSFLYMIAKDFSKTESYNQNYYENNEVRKEVKRTELYNTEPRKIYNSDTYFVAIFKNEKGVYNYGSEDVDAFPKNCINVIFLNSDLTFRKKLLKEDALINEVEMPNRFDKPNSFNSLKIITYLITEQDTNNNGKLDKGDLTYLYVSDLNGNNFRKIVKKDIIGYTFIDNGKEIALKYDKKKPKYAVYNIEKSKFKVSEKLNKLIDSYIN